MFDTYVLDRRARNSRGGWFATSLIFAATVVGGIMAALVAYSYWQITKVSPKYQAISFQQVAPPPEPPAAAAAPPPITSKDTNKDRVQKDPKDQLVQPDDTKPDPDPTNDPSATPDGDPNGVANGKVGGTGTDPNGDLNGDPNGIPGGTGIKPIEKVECIGAECDPPKPVKIDQHAMSARRIAGREQIPLSNDVKLKAVRDNKLKFMIGIRLCLDASGTPAKIELLGSSGYPEADAAVVSEMQNWRFEPYTVAGKPVPVCAAYIYQYEIGQ